MEIQDGGICLILICYLKNAILDACRQEPFNRGYGYRAPAADTRLGLASMPAPSGTVIAFATSPRNLALDGSGEYGLYTEVLAEQLQIPQRLTDVFMATRNIVSYRSGGEQIPPRMGTIECAVLVYQG